MIEINIWRDFRETEFEFNINVKLYRLFLNEETLRATWAFQEIWSLNFALEKPLMRRQNASFDWIKRQE
jgi:hypothetical protein